MNPLNFRASSQHLGAHVSKMMAVMALSLGQTGPLAAHPPTADLTTPSWWPVSVDRALERAGTNRNELSKTLTQIPDAQRLGLVFLIENMPERDIRTLDHSYLLQNIALAYEARSKVPWGAAISDELFFNDVLPYASVNETRDRWRTLLYEKCLPLVQDCKTPAQAAQRLNEKIFSLFKVKYSTGRKRADQSTLESMESGLASCTGLSILLVNACRAVAVPARVAGTPNWYNNRGNHTWIEVWDQGWHFAGAAEPDGKGLDHGWFAGDASRAIKDSAEHAIYATSFAKTDLTFPLVWARQVRDVSAVNVTERYTARATPSNDASRVRVSIRVFDSNSNRRVAALVRATRLSDTNSVRTGTSKGDSADLNDLLVLSLRRQETYLVEAVHLDRTAKVTFRSGAKEEELLELRVGGLAAGSLAVCAVPQTLVPLPADEEASLLKAGEEFFGASTEAQASWIFSERHEQLLAKFEPACRTTLWRAYRASPLHASVREDYASNQVRSGKYLSPYRTKTVGEKPADGWPLFIAMHGGGGAPKQVNDSQWKVMQNYYRDQSNVTGYVYLALRAPNDSWNGFYDTYVYPLIDTLIRQQVLCGDVDPNKVFLMGYSHGGYGAFAIGPKMPDHFAAIHSSAAAPTDGETTPKTLRHTRFTFMIGEKDHAYGRLARCTNFDNAIGQLRGPRSDIYPVVMEYRAGFGHGGLPDRDKISDLYPATRDPVPRDLTWEMTDNVITNFFWLRTTAPRKKRMIEAVCLDNRVTVTTSTNLAQGSVYLDTRLVDFDRPIVLEVNGHSSTHRVTASLKTFCQSLLERGDANLAFSARLDLKLGEAEQARSE